MVKRFFKMIFDKIINYRKKKKELDELYQNIQIGDLYFAKMPLSKKELNKIKEGHRSRPYLIVKKDKHYIYGYQCCSKKHSFLKEYEYYPLKKLLYPVYKDSYIYLNKVYKIPLKNIETYYITLYLNTIKHIEKQLLVSHHHYHYLPLFHVSIDKKEGDIVCLENNYYYIYSIDKNNIYSYRLYLKAEKSQYELIKMNIINKIYYLSYHEQVVFHQNDYLEFIYHLSFHQQYDLFMTKKAYKKLLRKEKQSYACEIKI